MRGYYTKTQGLTRPQTVCTLIPMALKYQPGRIQQLREALGLTRAEFARQVRVSRQMIANYEDEGYVPGTEILTRICDVTGAKLASFFADESDGPSVRSSVTRP
jgi:transcriptional regulator with XRE-family HTH domain